MKHLRLRALGALCALALSACGSLSSSEPAASTTPATTVTTSSAATAPASTTTTATADSSSAITANTVVADAAIALTAAQSIWINTCITPSSGVTPPAFCSDAATKAKVKASSHAATQALVTARDAIGAAKLSPAALMSLAEDAFADVSAYGTLVASLKGTN